jgi:Fe2+ or Zn2+ uptake regulation protein
MTDADRLRSAGLRVTSARLAILDAVRAGNHPGTEEIAQAARDRVGHVTVQAVYEALHALTAAGLVRRIVRSAYAPHAEDDDFGQPHALFEKVLTETEREHLALNIAAHAGAPEVTADTKSRVVEYWRNVPPDLGARVAKELNGG